VNDVFFPSIENEILMAAAALWRAGTNGDIYKVFLSQGDFDRLLAEFGDPPAVLTFTRFNIEVQRMRSDETFVLGDSSFTYLSQPMRLVELSLTPEVSES
jgi:hypothetical protein